MRAGSPEGVPGGDTPTPCYPLLMLCGPSLFPVCKSALGAGEDIPPPCAAKPHSSDSRRFQ